MWVCQLIILIFIALAIFNLIKIHTQKKFKIINSKVKFQAANSICQLAVKFLGRFSVDS